MIAQLQFWYSGGRGYYVRRTKDFNDFHHYDNYVKWMKNKGYTLDEVWTEDKKLLKYFESQMI